jgi:outer membrane protein
MTKLFKLLTIVLGLALVALPAQAYEKGDWVIRGGVGMVSPESTAYVDSVEDLSISVDDGTSAVISGTYMFTPNWGFDILASWPFSHDIKAGPAAGPTSLKIGETKHLPPTFSFQYHFAPDAKFAPYAGLGLNYTLFFDEELDQTLFPDTDLSIDGSFGVAAQVGADIELSEGWALNLDIRYISIAPDATLSDAIESDTIEIDINPMVYSLNLVFVF